MLIADTPTLGLLIGLPIAALLFGGCVLVAIGGFLLHRDEPHSDWNIPAWIATVGAVGTLIGTAILMWPWSAEYHFWKPIDGKVQRVGKRLVPAGDKGIQERYVVVVAGRPYGVDDTRAALLRPGDTVHLKCKREYEWGSSDNGWGCRWNGGAS